MTNSTNDQLNFEQPFNDAYLAQHTFDAKRLLALEQAISKAVRPGDIVADLGSGQGFLALFAIKAGAAKVYCVEIDESHTKYIAWLAKLNNAADKIVIISGDAKQLELPEPVDVILCEIISAGFYYEPQIQVMNQHLSSLRPGGRIVPEGMENGVELMNAQEVVYGLQLPPVTRWTDLPDDSVLTDAAVYHQADFYKRNDLTIRGSVTLTAASSGMANAVRILPDILVRNDRPGEPGTRYNTPSPTWGNPQIIWLKQPVELVKGKKYVVTLQYKASDHPDMSIITVSPK